MTCSTPTFRCLRGVQRRRRQGSSSSIQRSPHGLSNTAIWTDSEPIHCSRTQMPRTMSAAGKKAARDGYWSRHTRQSESPTSSPTRLADILSGLTPSTILKLTSTRPRNGLDTPTPRRPSATPKCARFQSPESSTQRRKLPQRCLEQKDSHVSTCFI